MIHKMNLWNNSFIAIKEVRKTIEMRLNDDKRRKIQTGDIIEFTNTIEPPSYIFFEVRTILSILYVFDAYSFSFVL